MPELLGNQKARVCRVARWSGLSFPYFLGHDCILETWMTHALAVLRGGSPWTSAPLYELLERSTTCIRFFSSAHFYQR